uniref:Serpentine receptor class gamma n=1 Tax=Caenorhabditis tropicalis TaxID=1561998 RepID=A0A1I7SYC6_9PELO
MAILFETRLLTFTVRDHWWRKYRVPWYHNQAFNNIVFIIVSSHGFLSTLSMIIVHTPYRKYTISLLKIETRLRNNNVLAVQVIKSPTNSQFKTVL